MSTLFTTDSGAAPDSLDQDTDPTEETREPTSVEVRRRAGLAALIAAAASAVAIAYLWRASQTMTVVDWSLCALLAVVAAYHLVALLDSRTPLLVADDLGIRIRLADQWRGLPWEAIEHVTVTPRRGLLRDGGFVVTPTSAARAVEGLDGRSARQARWNERLYGAALAVPLGLTTRTSTDTQALADEVAALSQGRAEVVHVRDVPVEAGEDGGPALSLPADPGADPGEDAGADTGTDRAADPEEDTGFLGAFREAEERRGDRAQRRRWFTGRPAEPTGATTDGSAALEMPSPRPEASVMLPEADQLRRGDDDTPGEPVAEPVAEPVPFPVREEPAEPLVLDDFAPEPAYDPVIGPELAAARQRVGLTVDELAERTRIRPHVIESIEVDDFAPCGGDFYARGHLRTLARVLGKDPVPLLEAFERRYASAPVNARRVFEAELATGMTGTMRSTMGGPNWSLLVGAVLALLLVWGVVRFLSTEPAELVTPAPVLSAPAEPRRAAPAPAGGSLGATAEVEVTLAARADTRAVVRDAEGDVVFDGLLAAGEPTRLEVVPPVRVVTPDGGVVQVTVDDRDRGTVGGPEGAVGRTFR